MKKIYIVSDAHFGAHIKEQEAKKRSLFLSLLDRVQEEKAELVINGDLFDFWFEYKYAVPRLHYEILSKLSSLIISGINIHYLSGNHDFWIGSFLSDEIGLKLHHNYLVIQNGKHKLYFCHGDGLLKKDSMYRFLKKILRHPLNIALYRWLHPDIGVPLALFFSNLSRNNNKNKTKYDDSDYRQFAYDKINNGYNVVALGHTHVPALEKYKNGWYVNSGDWIKKFTFIEIDESGPKLLKWDGAKGVLIQPKQPESIEING